MDNNCTNASSLFWTRSFFRTMGSFTDEDIAQHALNLLLNYFVWKYLFVSTVIGVTWYFLFWRSFNLYRDFTEFGFSEVNKQSLAKDNDFMKRKLINELRKRRQIGEVPPPYPNGWFVITESREVELKKAREVSCLGLNLVVWRGESGKSYVADAYCPHLGAHLGVGGEVAGECIKCPFHGWAFEGNDGKCTDIPYSDSIPDVAKINVRESLEMNGFIYLWYHAEGSKPNWYPERIPEVDNGEWKFRGKSVFRVACHIQETAENGSDINHLNIVHKSALMTGGKHLEAKVKWGFLTHKWFGGWETNPEPKSGHRAIMTVDHEMCLFDRLSFLRLKVKAHQVGPGLVHLIFKGLGGKGVLFFNVTPMEPLLQQITHSFYSSNTLIHPMGLLILMGEAIQLERDIGIWNRKMYMSRPLLTKEDKAIKVFRRWYSQFYSENSVRYSREQNNNFGPKDLSF